MRTPLLASALTTLALTLTGCGGDPFADDDREPAEVLADAVDATLGVDSFVVDTKAALTIGETDISLTAAGAVDYEALVADAGITVQQGEAGGEIEIRADGESVWFRTEGEQVPAIPQGKSWVQGEASILDGAATFDPAGLAGVVIALRAAEDVVEGGTKEIDGVQAREFSTTVTYADAVEAAGEDAGKLESSLSLTGTADQADLVIVAWVGEDDVIRDFDLDIEAGDVPVDGTYTVDVSGVDEDVEAPEAPAEEDVLTGAEADAFLSSVVQ
ncbi:hypothetical protein [Nocardioides donggukensis]|uniref:LppX_LprAFG lipoprotein n=1 Tax=Nocardioides donggukensis TaxID=2774019 RepID=A0A927K5Q1_9ACTN|nr:hypothetical protein [Nocardioides donggukensis]MBD8870772.1 hypothetical protein [Nocardioides donggukensis]